MKKLLFKGCHNWNHIKLIRYLSRKKQKDTKVQKEIYGRAEMNQN